MSKRWASAALLSLALGMLLTSCGPPSPKALPPPSKEVVVIRLSLPASQMALVPLYIAEHLGSLQAQGLTVVEGAGGTRLAPFGQWPVYGMLSVRPTLVLVSPTAVLDFRWRDLAHLPLAASRITPTDKVLIDAVLKEHGVKRVAWDLIPWSRAHHLLLTHHVPWLLMPLLPATMMSVSGQVHIIQFVGASSGPLPMTTISGTAPPVAFFKALNQGLVYLATHPARQIATLVAPDFPGVSVSALAAAIGDAQGLGVWPLSTWVDKATYEAGQTLLKGAGQQWPDYQSGVRGRRAEDALGEPPLR